MYTLIFLLRETLEPVLSYAKFLAHYDQTIVRLLHENNDKQENPSAVPAAQHRQSFLSPVDWLMGPPAESELPSENIHREWEKHHKTHREDCSSPKYIMMPNNQFRLAWDVFMALLLCMLAFWIPYRVCFYWNDDEVSQSCITSFSFY